MKNSLTIVLPVHNGESRLRASVHEMLELAGELTDRFNLLIIDDGSIDDTFEVANELAAEFPQVSVRRQSSKRGLGPALESIRGSVKSDIVVVHDGVTPLDSNQLRQLWRRYTQSQGGGRNSGDSIGDAIRELGGVAECQSTMSRAHSRIMGLQLMPSLASRDGEQAEEATAMEAPPERKPTYLPADDVGRIPSLPRPNFLEVITEFALGE